MADAVAILMASGGDRQDDLVSRLTQRHQLTEQPARQMISTMIDKGLFVESEPSAAEQQARRLRADWEARDWFAAAQYQLQTNDYPYVDYSRGGFVTDRQRMDRYGAERPDTDRSKRYDQPLESVELPGARELPRLGPITWRPPSRARRVVFDELAPLLSLVFGKTGELRVPWPNSAPLFLRTSPSNGARHPIEAYLLNLTMDGLNPGWWHIRWDQPALDRITGPISEADATGLLPGAFGWGPARPAAVLLFTIVFSRDMYRYREPRTLRAVYLDAGHLIGMAELVIGSGGFLTFSHDAVDAEACSEQLGLDPLGEGCMYTMAIAAR
ncbi:MAG TPA: SagB/ThcOx family dehydrogenase [Natronosporangium sp.]